jgi:hypothetical protein
MLIFGWVTIRAGFVCGRAPCNAVIGHDLVQEMRMMFQIDRAGLVHAMKFGGETDALPPEHNEFVARVIEECDVPAQVRGASLLITG